MRMLRVVASAAVLFAAAAVPAMAQKTPTSNATALGGATTPGNASGAPSSATPQGQISNTAVAPTPTLKSAVRARNTRRAAARAAARQPTTSPGTPPTKE